MKTFPWLVFAMLATSVGWAATAPADATAAADPAQKLVAGLKFQEGNITLPGDLAKITLPAKFQYLDKASTKTVLHDIWGNPGGSDSLGMIVPKGFDPLKDDNNNWAVVITYDEDGHVKDDDAASINYDKLLAEMKQDAIESSEARVKEGYKPIELVGWAAPPRYDAATHKMYWAKELKFGTSENHTLNYNIRILGRRGVLVLNAVGGMDQLKMIEASAPTILSMVNFQDGHRYADFDPSTDKVATYGLAALVAGGVAAKAGLFKMLWVGILAAKKLVIIGVVAVVAFVKKIWNRLSGKAS